MQREVGGKKSISLTVSMALTKHSQLTFSKEILPEFRLSRHSRGSFQNLMLLIVRRGKCLCTFCWRFSVVH